jgi:hypothetical protein
MSNLLRTTIKYVFSGQQSNLLLTTIKYVPKHEKIDVQLSEPAEAGSADKFPRPPQPPLAAGCETQLCAGAPNVLVQVAEAPVQARYQIEMTKTISFIVSRMRANETAISASDAILLAHLRSASLERTKQRDTLLSIFEHHDPHLTRH